MTPKEYKTMIQSFLDKRISAEEFETRFLTAIKTEPEGMDSVLYGILDKLFGDVDAYWHECLPGQETPFMISEEQLRQEATNALKELEQFLSDFN